MNVRNISQIAFAVLVGLGAIHEAQACDCNLASDRAKYPEQCGITTTPATSIGVGSTSGAGASSTTGAIHNAVKTNVSTQQSADAKGGKATGGAATVGNVASTSAAAGGAGGNGGAGGEAQSNAAGGSGGTASQDSHDVTSYAASRIPVNTALAGVGMTTAGCRYAQGLGVQGMNVGTSIGLSFKDKTCVKAALAEGFYARGQWNAGDRIECSIPEVHDALGADCIAILGETRTDEGRVYVPPASPDAVTHAELQEAIKRVFVRTASK